MCQTLPGEIIAIVDEVATVRIRKNTYQISLKSLSEPVKVGDFVMTHGGFATAKVDAKTAEEIFSLYDEMEGEL